MAETEEHGSVRYKAVPNEYFEKRQLKRHARVWSLWALGVGAVISSHFFGWNFGLAAGGFGGMLVAAIIVTVMYLGLCLSIAEMSPALPHTGGAYSFSRSAMGPWAGYVTGLAESMEFILTPAVVVVGIGGYLGAIFDTPDWMAPAWWFFSYLIFVGLNIWGAEMSFRFTVCITFVALAILLVFYVGAFPHFAVENLKMPTENPGGSAWFPRGWLGVIYAFPFAIWLYLAIEQLPLAAEESRNPKRDIPRGILLALGTLVVTGFLILFLNAGIAPGAAVVGWSDEPLFLGLQTIFGNGIGAKLLALAAAAGLIATFHTIIFACGRNIFALSRAGYFPKWLSLTHSRRRTPHVALIVGATIGYAAALIIRFSEDIFGDAPVAAVLLNMAVFGAVISYAMQCLAFIKLRKKLPNIERPFVSPLGLPGAWVALAIALATLLFLFLNPDHNVGTLGMAIWYLVALMYFALYSRHRLVKSPEENFAVEERAREAGRGAEDSSESGGA